MVGCIQDLSIVFFRIQGKKRNVIMLMFNKYFNRNGGAAGISVFL